MLENLALIRWSPQDSQIVLEAPRRIQNIRDFDLNLPAGHPVNCPEVART